MSRQYLTESQEKASPRFAPNQSASSPIQTVPDGFHPVSQLQRKLGNRDVTKLIRTQRLTPAGIINGLQRKLTVGAANDQYEQEADRVARQVMNMPDAEVENSMQRSIAPEEEKDKMLQTKPLAASITPFVQRVKTNVEEPEDKKKRVQARFSIETDGNSLQRQPEADDEEKEPVQAKSAGLMSDSFEVGADIETQLSQSKGHGSPLPEPVRTYMEPRFGVDFSQVRIHTGGDAVRMNRNVGAQAFTHGSDIYFGEGRGTDNLELTAHELTHVIQQTGGAPLQRKKKEGSIALGSKPFIQRKCAACAADEKDKKESSPASLQPKRMDKPYLDRCIQRSEAVRDGSSGAEGSYSFFHASSIGRSGLAVRRTPAPGRDFGTYGYCGFGITTSIPGFIKGLVTDGYDVDYTSGCAYIWLNTWSSVWELYDASNRKLDSNSETPLGSYTIPADKLNAGTPSDGSSSKWSLWYRVTRSNFPGDDDAYPYDYKTFDVFSEPIRDPRTSLIEETGPIIWQNNFRPAEDGATLDYNITTSTQRSTEDSQTTSVSGTIGGSQDAQIGFTYDGLTGGFSRNLSYSATASISRTHSVSVSTSRNETFTFHQPNLRGGVTYRVTARPIFHRINGSVQLISHRDGVVSSGGNLIEGGIRTLKGLDISVEASDVERVPEDEVGVLVKRKCWAGRNCTGKAYSQKFAHCHNCKNYASGRSLGEPGNCENC